MIMIYNFIIFFAVLLVQFFFPSIDLYSFKIVPDFLLILLTLYSFQNDRLYCVIIGFFMGLFQDLVSQMDLIGVLALSKSVSGFLLGTLRKYLSFFTKKIVYLNIIFIYGIHSSIYSFFRYNDLIIDIFLIFKIVIINSLISFLIYILIDNILYNKKSMLR